MGDIEIKETKSPKGFSKRSAIWIFAGVLLILAVCIACLIMFSGSSESTESDFIIENGVLTKYTGTASHVTIPDTVTAIGNEIFAGCSSIKSITIPDGVTSIGKWAFAGCSGLKSITIPDGVTSIGVAAFWECSGLKSVTIPNSVTSIGSSVFNNCSRLKRIYCEASSKPSGWDENWYRSCDAKIVWGS